MKLSIIIIVYNGFNYLEKCLTSLYETEYPDMEIIVIDNASTEKGLELLFSRFPKIIFIKNTKNLGFAKGVNIGLKKARGKYVLILNPDTTILKGTFEYLLNNMKQNHSIALAGCKILNQKKQLLQSAGYRFPNIFSHIYEYNYPFYRLLKALFPNYHPLLYNKHQLTKEMYVKHLMGAFLLFRKSILEKIGDFDEEFFLYREETDFCKRIIDRGLTIVYLPEIGGVVHIGAGSSKIKITQTSPFYMESTYKFFEKYHSSLYVRTAYILGTLSSFISFIYFVLKNNREYAFAWKQAFFWHIKNI